MSVTFFDIQFPSAQQNLGLFLEAHTLAYSAGGTQKRVECVVVTESTVTSDIRVGDILVSVNSLPLINSKVPMGTSHLAFTTKTLLEQKQLPRTLRFMRSGNNADRSYSTTVVSISVDDAELIFDNDTAKKLRSGEQYYYETNPSSISLFTIKMPSDLDLLRLSIRTQKLTYVLDNGGEKRTIYCCVIVDNGMGTQIVPGDVLVKVNYDSTLTKSNLLVNNNKAEEIEYHNKLVDMLTRAERPVILTFLRPSTGVSLNGLSPSLIVCLTRNEEEMMYSSIPLNALPEEDEITRRVEQQLYVMKKEKEEKKKIEEARKRAEEEAKRISDMEEA